MPTIPHDDSATQQRDRRPLTYSLASSIRPVDRGWEDFGRVVCVVQRDGAVAQACDVVAVRRDEHECSVRGLFGEDFHDWVCVDVVEG
jgi:hypothetical protein